MTLAKGVCAVKHTFLQRLAAGHEEQMMPKTQPLCTGAKSNLGDRVQGEVESKGDTVDLSPSKLHIPTWRNLSFIAVVQGCGC